MNRPTIIAKLVEILGPLSEERVPVIGEDTQLTGDLELDSLKIMEMLTDAEDAFDISIPINEVSDVKTVGDLADVIQKIGTNA